MTSALQQVIAELSALDQHVAKVQGEVVPAPRSFQITGLKGVFADDSGIVLGDTCHVVVVRGKVGSFRTDGLWGNITPGTIVEYWITHAGVDSLKGLEGFYSG